MRRIKFSLRVLILLFTAAVLMLGATQWRRQRIIRSSDYFKRYGVDVVVPHSWADYIWQRRPDSAVIKIPNKLYAIDNEEMNSELARFGITQQIYEVQEITTDWEDAIDETQ
jgi:hypothetical protein